ncbi:hypothetical protein JR316_0000235 [Psilocybe cubensis]|uniref:Uncharacterized protein n=2 Tax=Psilocybe cubensis TaxID=181762 RepID=A0A8H8CQ26_PSICU|nr:hypothetical protein JR316_0000235 [Psilocybe cubensis]KAH9486171.1 hypothetical protein JR316_0000235 [Psilocybe cubensis]
MTTPLRTFFLCSLVAVGFISLYHILPFDILANPFSDAIMAGKPATQVGRLAGFIARAELLPPSRFDPPPPRKDIALIALLNAPVEQNGVSLVLFTDHTLLSASGAYYKLTADDYTALHALARDITHGGVLPVPEDSFRNTWRVRHERTGRPIDRFLVPKRTLSEVPEQEYEREFDEVSVYGWDREKRELQTPVGAYTELPDQLYEAGAVVAEARVGADGQRNEDTLKKVRGILGNVF